jgi:hypothetical protein
MITQYLSNNYPKNSKIWHLVVVAFLNQYHRSISDNLLYEIGKSDKNSFIRLFGARLCGGATKSALEWLRFVDAELSSLLSDKASIEILFSHFEVHDIQKSSQRFFDLVYGEGESQRIRGMVSDSFSS